MDFLFEGIFKPPYAHIRWLRDQETLIQRLRAVKNTYLDEQADRLEAFQQHNQCSVVMVDIIKDRISVNQDLIKEKIE